MFDESRTRALVFTATSLRPFFVAFVGLCLVQMLSGCILGSERPDLAPDLPAKYGAGNGESAPPAAGAVFTRSGITISAKRRRLLISISRQPLDASCRPTLRPRSSARRCC